MIELPLGAVDCEDEKCKIWWIATIKDELRQAVTEIPKPKGMKDWEVEMLFANSTLKLHNLSL